MYSELALGRVLVVLWARSPLATRHGRRASGVGQRRSHWRPDGGRGHNVSRLLRDGNEASEGRRAAVAPPDIAAAAARLVWFGLVLLLRRRSAIGKEAT